MSAFDAKAKSIFGAALLLGVVSTVLAPAIMLDGIGATFFAGMGFRLIVCAFGIGRDRVLPITLDEKGRAVLLRSGSTLPRGGEWCRALVDALGSLDYPLSKLEILILVETDDIATREALARINLAPRISRHRRPRRHAAHEAARPQRRSVDGERRSDHGV